MLHIPFSKELDLIRHSQLSFSKDSRTFHINIEIKKKEKKRKKRNKEENEFSRLNGLTQGRSNYALAHLVAGSRLGLIALTKRKGDIYGRVHVFPHTLRSIFGRAANPEFLPRFSYVARARAVRYASLHRLLPRTSGPWVRADNTRRVDLVNLPATFIPPRFYDFT